MSAACLPSQIRLSPGYEVGNSYNTGTWSLLDEAAAIRRSEFEREALQVLEEHESLTPGQYALAMGRKRATQLSRMLSKNLITKQDGRYRVIVLSCYL